jgi:excisionase family DNA binding protein
MQLTVDLKDLERIVEKAVRAAMRPAQPDEYLTKREAAAMLKLSPRAFHSRIKSGEIPHVKHGRRVLVTRAGIEKYLKRGQVGG